MSKREKSAKSKAKVVTGGERRVIARKDGRIEFGFPPPPFVSAFKQFGGYARGSKLYLANLGVL